MTKYGFSTSHAELEEILGLEPGRLERSGLDMDLADDCRWLHEHGVDLSDEAAVRTAHEPRDEGSDIPHFANGPKYVNALVRVARDFTQDRGDHADDTHSEGDQAIREARELEHYADCSTSEKAILDTLNTRLPPTEPGPVTDDD